MFAVRHIVLVIIISLSGSIWAYHPLPKQKAKAKPSKGVRFGGGPVAGFYTINRHHARGILNGGSGLISLKKEIRFGRDFRTFFHYGLEYFFYGYSFSSYYFTQDTLRLYDKAMTYKYSVFAQELDLPLQVKYSFNRENNSQYTHYFMIGYHFRYILPADLKVTEGNNVLQTDKVTMKFKNHLVSEQINTFLSASVGWQKNNTGSSKAGIFIEVNYRYGFSPYYFETKYSASSLFVSSSHIGLQVGVKF